MIFVSFRTMLREAEPAAVQLVFEVEKIRATANQSEKPEVLPLCGVP